MPIQWSVSAHTGTGHFSQPSTLAHHACALGRAGLARLLSRQIPI